MLRNNRFILWSLLLIIPVCVIAGPNKEWIKTDLPKYESELLEELAKLPKEKHYGLYVLAGRSFYNHGLLPYALKYYEKAIKEQTKLDKSEPYFKLVHVHYRMKNWDLMGAALKQAKSYWKRHPKYAKENYTRAITFYETSHPKQARKIVKVPAKNERDDGLSIALAEHNYYAHFRNKNYKKALSELDPVVIKDQGFYHQKVEYDLLSHLIKQQPPKELMCDSFHKRFPTSYSYEVLICDALKTYRKTGKVSETQIKRLSAYFDKFDKDLKFLLQAVKSLNRA